MPVKRSKLSRRIFDSILLVSAVVLVVAMALVITVLYRNDSLLYIESLKNEASCLAQSVNKLGNESLASLSSTHRVTLVGTDGTVLFDNTVPVAGMESHAAREEIREAFSSGSGYAERYSSSLQEKTVNIALLLDNGCALRVSDELFTVFSILPGLALPLIITFAVACLLALVLASRVSRSVTRPINELNLEHPDRTAVYDELSPLIDRLTRQNEQIEAQLRDLQEEHDKQDAMRRDFTANVSHELKTPLTSISGYAELMKNGIVRPGDVTRFAGKIYDESQRLITLVGDIIKLSQLDGKDISVKIEDIDLFETCEAVLSQLELAAREKAIRLQLTGEHLFIRGAEQIVEEMIFNLCDNAVKYNVPGGSVTVSIRQCVDGVELEVADTGIGISPEDIPHIFERFYRVDKSHSKEIGGTGLGLSIVKHGARFMDASVSVDSKPGKGTSVRILF